MTRATVVGDASALVAMLVDDGPEGDWSAGLFATADLAVPQLAPFEIANILRRLELAEKITTDQAAQAHADLLILPLETWPYELLADRAWALRGNLTADDGSYVALAERLGAPLATLDRRIARAPGIRCDVISP